MKLDSIARSKSTDPALRNRARRIVKDLGEGEHPLLQRWMAHYIAELMQRAQDPALSQFDRDRVTQQCAAVIAELSRIESLRERTQLGYALYQFERFAAPKSESLGEPKLRLPLLEPTCVQAWSGADRIVALFRSAELEQEIIRLLITSSILDETLAGTSNGSREPEHEAYTREALRAQRRIASAFPLAVKIEVSNHRQMARFAQKALETVLALQAELLRPSAARARGQPKEVATRKKRQVKRKKRAEQPTANVATLRDQKKLKKKSGKRSNAAKSGKKRRGS